MPIQCSVACLPSSNQTFSQFLATWFSGLVIEWKPESWRKRCTAVSCQFPTERRALGWFHSEHCQINNHRRENEFQHITLPLQTSMETSHTCSLHWSPLWLWPKRVSTMGARESPIWTWILTVIYTNVAVQQDFGSSCTAKTNFRIRLISPLLRHYFLFIATPLLPVHLPRETKCKQSAEGTRCCANETKPPRNTVNCHPGEKAISATRVSELPNTACREKPSRCVWQLRKGNKCLYLSAE